MGRGFSFTDPMPGDLHTCHPAMQCSGLTRESDQSEISLPYLDWSYPAFTSQVLIEFKSVDTALLVMNYLLPYTPFHPTNEHCYSIAMLIKKGSDQLHSLVSSVLILTAKKHHAMNTESNHPPFPSDYISQKVSASSYEMVLCANKSQEDAFLANKILASPSVGITVTFPTYK